MSIYAKQCILILVQKGIFGEVKATEMENGADIAVMTVLFLIHA